MESLPGLLIGLAAMLTTVILAIRVTKDRRDNGREHTNIYDRLAKAEAESSRLRRERDDCRSRIESLEKVISELSKRLH